MHNHIITFHIKMREFLSDELFEARAARQRYSRANNRTGESMSDGEVQAYTKAMNRINALTTEALKAIAAEMAADFTDFSKLNSKITAK